MKSKRQVRQTSTASPSTQASTRPDPDWLELVKFVLERAYEAPLHRRVRICRALADFCGDETEAGELQQLARELDNADRRCRGFAFKFASQFAVS
jgi:hypothetical protein